MIFRLDQLAPVSLVHAGTITSLRNSGANCAERRDYAVLTGPDRTEASLGTGNQAAATVHAAVEPSTWTEHLCRMREAHRVSWRRGAPSLSVVTFFLPERRPRERERKIGPVNLSSRSDHETIFFRRFREIWRALTFRFLTSSRISLMDNSR